MQKGIVLSIALIISFNAQAVSVSSCAVKYKNFSQRHKALENFNKSLYHLTLSGGHLLKTGWYSLKGLGKIYVSQFTFPLKITTSIAKKLGLPIHTKLVYGNRFEFIKSGGKAITGYLLFGVVPDIWTTSIVDFHASSDDEFFKPQNDALYVVVDGFEEEGFLDRNRKVLIKGIVEKKKQSGFPVEYVSPENWEQLAKELNKISQKYGRPITHIDFYSHGSYKSIGLNDQIYTDYKLDVDNRDKYSFYSSDQFFFKYLNKNTIAPIGQFRFNGCLVGHNPEFLNKFGERLFSDSGVVHASKLITTASGANELVQFLSHIEHPGYIAQTLDFMGGPVKLGYSVYVVPQEWQYDFTGLVSAEPHYFDSYTRVETKNKKNQ